MPRPAVTLTQLRAPATQGLSRIAELPAHRLQHPFLDAYEILCLMQHTESWERLLHYRSIVFIVSHPKQQQQQPTASGACNAWRGADVFRRDRPAGRWLGHGRGSSGETR